MAAPDHRCRLCSTNDREALVEDLAAAMWEGSGDDGAQRVWSTAPEMWADKFMRLADDALKALEMERPAETTIGILETRR